MPARPSLNMVWSSASSTRIDPLALVFPFSANLPLRSVGASGKALYRQCLVGPKMFPLRCGETHPYGAPREFERYSPKCLEGLFSEVRRSKRPIRRRGKHPTTACWHPLAGERPRLRSIRCTEVYQGVATRNDATTREILRGRTRAMGEVCIIMRLEVATLGGKHNMVVRVLLVLALLATLCGCGQASTLSEHPENKGPHEVAGQPGIGPTGAAQKRDGASRRGAPTVAEKRGRPNIILILTDDLDDKPESISRMPNLQRYLVDRGTTFDNAFVSDALCCPSRATILRGQYPHNHCVLTNHPPLGGEERFTELGLEDSTGATWLHSEGYSTVMLGKYLNGFVPPVPPGWDLWYGRGSVPVGTYETDYFSSTAAYLIRTKRIERKPFFMWLGTAAPHRNVDPPPRYAEAFPNVKAPRPPSFNEEDVSDKPRWLRQKPPLSESDIDRIDEQYRIRLQTTLAVDDLIGNLVEALRKSGELDNTYIFFTSDNGFVKGEHRRPQGKWSAYEEAMRVPLIVRGPGVPEGETVHKMVLNNDLAPTFAALGGASVPSFVDGRSLVPLLGSTSPAPSDWRTAFLEEGRASKTGRPAFKAIRTTDHPWVEYADGERELYDLKDNPYELESKDGTAPEALKRNLAGRLDELRDCSKEGCRDAEGF